MLNGSNSRGIYGVKIAHNPPKMSQNPFFPLGLKLGHRRDREMDNGVFSNDENGFFGWTPML